MIALGVRSAPQRIVPSITYSRALFRTSRLLADACWSCQSRREYVLGPAKFDIARGSKSSSYNAVLDAMADFRGVHHGWEQEYINRRWPLCSLIA